MQDFKKGLEVFIDCKSREDINILEFINKVGYVNYLNKNYEIAVEFYREAIDVMDNQYISNDIYLECLDHMTDSLFKLGRKEEGF